MLTRKLLSGARKWRQRVTSAVVSCQCFFSFQPSRLALMVNVAKSASLRFRVAERFGKGT